jgi:phenylacetate-coenzyme A ligase PaaK-like adenylate-forming protein
VERFGNPCVVVSGTYLPRFAGRILDALLRFRPAFVTMFLPMVFSILAEARRRGLSGPRAFDGVHTLVVTGAPITPGMKARLASQTGVARIAEIAGTSENVLAVDCGRADGLHVVPDTCYVEVLDRVSRAPVAPGERGTIVHCALVDEGSIYLRYDGGDAGTIDPSPCPCGLPSPRIRMLGRWETSFVLGGRRWLPWDIQRAAEEEVPEASGVSFAILREDLAQGRLRLLVAESDLAGSLREHLRDTMRRRFEVPVEVVGVRELPLRFKGVAPVVSAAELEGGVP